MVMRCENCPLRRRGVFTQMTEEEVAQTQRLKVGEMTVEPGTSILTEGTRSAQIYTILEGLGLRHKTLENGRRQVISFVFPGDLIGLQAALMDDMSHSVEARSRMRLCVFDRAGLRDLFRNAPDRAYDLTWLAAADEHFLGEALTTVGQRTAEQAVAWALVRIWKRADGLDMVQDGRMPLPFRQQDLADALGLSLVHTNKTLAKFRERQIAIWREGTLSITDLELLARIGLTDTDPPRTRPMV